MYNSSKFILESIKSIQNQTHQNWELWLIDDASKDNTLEVVSQLLKADSRINLLQNKTNSGAALSRNLGIKNATGDFIAFLDADDLWLPEKLEIQLKVLSQTNCDVCFSSYYQINETGSKKLALVSALPQLSYKKLLKSNYIGNLTGIYNAKKLGKISSPNLRKRQDWLLWLKTLKSSQKPAVGIKEPLALYRVRENSMSSNKLKLVKHNYWVYKKGLGYSSITAFYKLIIFFKEHFFVKSKFIKKLN